MKVTGKVVAAVSTGVAVTIGAIVAIYFYVNRDSTKNSQGSSNEESSEKEVNQKPPEEVDETPL